MNNSKKCRNKTINTFFIGSDIPELTVIFCKRLVRRDYEVEILDEEGNPKAQCTLLPDDLELVEN